MIGLAGSKELRFKKSLRTSDTDARAVAGNMSQISNRSMSEMAKLFLFTCPPVLHKNSAARMSTPASPHIETDSLYTAMTSVT
jgi:hypothetical protein